MISAISAYKVQTLGQMNRNKVSFGLSLNIEGDHLRETFFNYEDDSGIKREKDLIEALKKINPSEEAVTLRINKRKDCLGRVYSILQLCWDKHPEIYEFKWMANIKKSTIVLYTIEMAEQLGMRL